MMSIFLTIALCTILILAAVQDLRVQKIPNLLTYPTMGMGVIYHSVTNGLDGFFFAATGLAAGIGLLIVPYIMGGMGAGDAKLMGAIGAVVGPKGVFTAFLFSAVIGGLYALLLILLRGQLRREFVERHLMTLKTFLFTRQFIPIPAAEDAKKPKLCYGIAIAFGTLLYISLELSGYNPIM
ncbi:MAG: prepilin peptidase [Deltaproteobacteria bacterium]|nr:prepilin peptidase [Deltaproteobacteria bacterium]